MIRPVAEQLSLPYLPGATGEAADLPGALSLATDAELKPQPQPSQRQEEMDLHPSPPRKPQGPIPLRQSNHTRRTMRRHRVTWGYPHV